MRKIIGTLMFGFLMCGALQAQDTTSTAVVEEPAFSDSSALFDISFEDLINLQVTTASKTAERAVEAPAVLSVITKQEIENYGALTLGEILERVTGIFVTSSFSATQNILSFRGDQTGDINSHVLILIDGRPTRESIYNGSNTSIYNAYPIETIERIEVIRGPGSVLYGTCAMVGVVNIITKSGGEGFGATAGYGSFGTFRSAVNGKYGKKDWEIQGGAQVRMTDGWLFKAYDEGTLGTANRDSINKAETSLGGQLKLRYKGFKFNSFWTYALQNAMGGTPQWNAPADYQQLNSRYFADLGYEHQILKFWKATINVTYNGFHTDGTRYKVGNEEVFDGNTNDVLVEQTNYLELRKNLHLVVGGIFNHQTGQLLIPNIVGSTNFPFDITRGKNPDPLIAIPDYRLSQTSIYTQADYKPYKWIKLVAGLQANKVPAIEWDFVPRLGLVLNPLKPIFIKALYGSAFRAGSAFERRINIPYFLTGRNDILPERVNTFEAQLAYAKTTWSVSVTYYNSRISNLIRVSQFGGRGIGDPNASVADTLPRYYNAGSYDFQGLELEANANLSPLVKGLSAVASFTYQMNQDDKKRENITLMPNYTAKIGIAYKSSFGLRLGWFNSYFGGVHQPELRSPEGKMVTRFDNPQAKPFLYGTLNVGYDISTILFPESRYREAVGLDVYITNLYDQAVMYPEFVRGRINTVPGRGGFGLFGRITFKI